MSKLARSRAEFLRNFFRNENRCALVVFLSQVAREKRHKCFYILAHLRDSTDSLAGSREGYPHFSVTKTSCEQRSYGESDSEDFESALFANIRRMSASKHFYVVINPRRDCCASPNIFADSKRCIRLVPATHKLPQRRSRMPSEFSRMLTIAARFERAIVTCFAVVCEFSKGSRIQTTSS
jgi:hypothetical protein